MSATIQQAPTATMSIASGQAGVFPCTYGYYPAEGSRVVTAMYNWGAQTGYQEDVSQLVARGVETTIQSVYVDNSAGTQPVTLTIAGSDQVIIVPPQAQGIFPAFFTGTPLLTISVPALAPNATRCYFLNVPVGPAVWSQAPAFNAMAGAAALNVTASTVLKTSAGRVARVIVNTVTAGAAIVIADSPSGAGNAILTIPTGTAAGTIFILDWPFATGLSVEFGAATGALAISYQ